MSQHFSIFETASNDMAQINRTFVILILDKKKQCNSNSMLHFFSDQAKFLHKRIPHPTPKTSKIKGLAYISKPMLCHSPQCYHCLFLKLHKKFKYYIFKKYYKIRKKYFFLKFLVHLMDTRMNQFGQQYGFTKQQELKVI